MWSNLSYLLFSCHLIGYLGPKNSGLDNAEIKFLCYLEAEIDENRFVRKPFGKIQDGGHIVNRANRNIVFWLLYYKISKSV